MKTAQITVGAKCSISKLASIGFEESGAGIISIGDRCKIRPYVVLRTCGGKLIIERNVTIGHFVYIAAKGNVIIRSNTLIAPHVGIYAQNHGTAVQARILSQSVAPGKVVIGSDCWIGANVVIVGPVKIGNHVVIGANAVVVKDIPDNAVAVGNPARIVKYRGKKT